jgi:hypothetical protein
MEVRAARAVTMSNALLKEEVIMFDTVTTAAGPAHRPAVWLFLLPVQGI